MHKLAILYMLLYKAQGYVLPLVLLIQDALGFQRDIRVTTVYVEKNSEKTQVIVTATGNNFLTNLWVRSEHAQIMCKSIIKP